MNPTSTQITSMTTNTIPEGLTMKTFKTWCMRNLRDMLHVQGPITSYSTIMNRSKSLALSLAQRDPLRVTVMSSAVQKLIALQKTNIGRVASWWKGRPSYFRPFDLRRRRTRRNLSPIWGVEVDHHAALLKPRPSHHPQRLDPYNLPCGSQLVPMTKGWMLDH